MIGKKNTGRLFGLFLAFICGSLIVLLVHQIWPGMHTVVLVISATVVYVGVYLAGSWALVERREELDRKFPPSSKELRRRAKELYAGLDSLGRR